MSSALFDLTGKRAVVTGANTGLGQAMAVALASAGADVALISRSSASDTVAQISKLGRRAVEVPLDLSDNSNCELAIAQSDAALGPIDILVNNAGIIRRNDALEFTEADWDDVLQVNLKSAFFLAQAFAKRVVARGGRGKIINIASMLSYQGGIRVVSYTASKSGVMGMTRLLANEWASKSINVNAIAPGYFSTNNTAALRADEKRNSEILGRIPAGRWGQPDDLGGAVIFLASSASDYVQGITLPVDGGWLAR